MKIVALILWKIHIVANGLKKTICKLSIDGAHLSNFVEVFILMLTLIEHTTLNVLATVMAVMNVKMIKNVHNILSLVMINQLNKFVLMKKSVIQKLLMVKILSIFSVRQI